MPHKPNRQSTRLRNYDYSKPGSYFITICVKDRYCLFGDVVDGVMQLNEHGRIAENELMNISSYYDNVNIDEFIVMPNHIHMIIKIEPENVGARLGAPEVCEDIAGAPRRTPTVGNIICSYKSGVTRIVGNAFMRSIEVLRIDKKSPIWQRNYHDRIIRTPNEFCTIRNYIHTNPKTWHDDCHNPNHPKFNDWKED